MKHDINDVHRLLLSLSNSVPTLFHTITFQSWVFFVDELKNIKNHGGKYASSERLCDFDQKTKVEK